MSQRPAILVMHEGELVYVCQKPSRMYPGSVQGTLTGFFRHRDISEACCDECLPARRSYLDNEAKELNRRRRVRDAAEKVAAAEAEVIRLAPNATCLEPGLTGTEDGWKAHRRIGEFACNDCTEGRTLAFAGQVRWSSFK